MPRDIVRFARELVQKERSSGKAMNALAGAVIRTEITGKVAAAEVRMRTVGSEERDSLLAWLQRWDVERPTVASLHASWQDLMNRPVVRATARSADETRARALATELAAFSYYAATVLEFFCDTPLLRSVLVTSRSSTGDLEEHATAAIEELAGARNRFALSPALAADRANSFRDLVGLPRLQLPETFSLPDGTAAPAVPDNDAGGLAVDHNKERAARGR